MLKQILSILFILIIQSDSIPQVKQDWVSRFANPPGGVYNIAGIDVDNLGNVFISGSMIGATLTDYVTIKYNSSGAEQWRRIYTGLIEDRVIDMVLDNSGNVCVTGLSENQTGTYDIITVKYNTNGDSLWVKRYNGASSTAMDQPVAMFVDPDDNIYVSGYTFGSTPMVFVTIKYSPQGDSLWVAKYPSGGTNLPRDIIVDDNGNVYVYGRGTTILKYGPEGNLLWNRTYSLEAAETNKVLCSDNSGSIYFAAKKSTATFGDFAVVKINSSGDTLWSRVYNGLGNLQTNHDDPAALCMDNSGNIFLTGQVYNLSSYFFSTIKYNSSGNFQWERVYSNPQNGEGGNAVLTDNTGNVYVTGGSNDFTTFKYNSAGDSLWTMSYNGPSNMNDISDVMTIDNSGNIYIAGRSRQAGSPAYYDIVTVKYSQTITGISTESDIPKNFNLFQNYPNPFNPVTILEFGISDFGFVTLKIYDVLGKEVMVLVNKGMNPGTYKYNFDGGHLPGGIYFYELKIESDKELYSEVKRMILLK